MPSVLENIKKYLNRIYRMYSTKRLPGTSKQNYGKYFRTYYTLSRVFKKLEGLDAYLVGGVSAAIQTNHDLYRENCDLDIMCREEDLGQIIKTLEELGYSVKDRRGIKTRNKRGVDGEFHASSHELDADTSDTNMLGIGLFTYQVKGNEVITHTYAFEEREGRIVGFEKVMPKELFELMYDSREVEYKGMKLKTNSKEYVYMKKMKGKREKDKQDVSILEPTLDEKSKEKMQRIKELEARVKVYKLLYDKEGKITSRTQLPTFEDRIYRYMDYLYMNDTTKTPEQIISDAIQSTEYAKAKETFPQVDSVVESWRKKTKDYTYRNKIELLTKEYSRKLNEFSKEGINNVLDFLQNRSRNDGRSDSDIELNDDAKKIFELMAEYQKRIKNIFVDNNISLTHVTNVAPDRLEDGVLKKSIDRENTYKTERVDGVFASSKPLDGTNPYIARNDSGMVRLGEKIYIYGNDNVDVVQDSEGKKRAMLRQPNYAYHLNPKWFMPVCTLTWDSRTNRPVFEFSEEWIAENEMNISDPEQVISIDKIEDVTSLLEHYTVLSDIQSQGIGWVARHKHDKKEVLKYIREMIANGSVRNINHEAGINDREFLDDDRDFYE